MQWFAGTSGYSYKEWKGPFYPDDIKPDGMLAYYASQLPAVEINNTFYRMPRTNVLDAWRETTPDDFRFVIKASRRITHNAKLEDCEDSVEYLASKLEALEDKLACVLFQLPPYLRKGADRLDAFLSAWPKAFPAAVEFRHESWFDDEIADVLRRNDAAICVSEDAKFAAPDFYATTDWVYLRLRKQNYDSAALDQWAARATQDGVKTGYAFFKHEDDGAGPALARTFLARARGEPSEPIQGDADGQSEAPRQKPRASVTKSKSAKKAG